MRRLIVPLFAVVVGLVSPRAGADAPAQPQIHVVAEGQRLESIARRYTTSVDALCNASGIQRTERLRIGQRLVVPGKGDDNGDQARRLRESGRFSDADSGRAAAPRVPQKGDAPKKESESPIARVHHVAAGQTLGKIAHRYNVTVEAIQTVNRFGADHRLQPGEKLLIPSPGVELDALRLPAGASEAEALPAREKEKKKPQVHQIEAGHTLGKLAKRYHVSVEALRTANDLEAGIPLKLGQKLVIPVPGEEDSSAVHQLRAELDAAEQEPRRADTAESEHEGPHAKPVRFTRTRTWKFYAERPRHKGYLTLNGWTQRWQGYVIGKKDKILPAAYEGISRFLGAYGNRPRLEPRLLRTLVEVSDTFGGRPLRVVSAFRRESFFADSRHRQSKAIDFSIPGVPNEALRDYLMTRKSVGIGYYPNSSFVHLDSREVKTYWVDYSGPGEAPRNSPNAPPRDTSEAVQVAQSTGDAESALPGSHATNPNAAEGAAANHTADSHAADNPTTASSDTTVPGALGSPAAANTERTTGLASPSLPTTSAPSPAAPSPVARPAAPAREPAIRTPRPAPAPVILGDP